MKTITLINGDIFNAHYEDGKLVRSDKPDYLDIETMSHVFPTADIYWVPSDVYDDVLNGEDYPTNLSDFPVDRCNKIR